MIQTVSGQGYNMKRKKHILVVDDVVFNLKCAEDVLKDKYDLTLASSGKEALECLQKGVPDLVLLDVIMPEMDGYETFANIREIKGMEEVPIIFLTADIGVGSEVMGLQMGAMDYIHKPFDPNIMLSRIKRVLEIEDIKKQLEASAKKDSLTGLWNRNYLQEILNRSGELGAQGAFILFDMDNFKYVNDTFGHLVGDAVLSRFAEGLKERMKPGDVACRLGGDEFAVFINDSMSRSEFAQYLSQWIEQLEGSIQVVKGEDTNITVSAGVVGMPSDGKDFITLYNKADKALYHVKKNGKRTFHFYQEKETLDFESLSNQVDLHEIRERITDKQGYKGVFQLEYEGFSHIFQFIQRSVERSKQNVQMVLLSVRAKAGMEQDHDSTGKLIRLMEDTIVNSLRKGDVANRYNNSQYVILLVDADLNEGKIAAERIVNKCQSQFNECGYEINYDIQTIEKKTEK